MISNNNDWLNYWKHQTENCISNGHCNLNFIRFSFQQYYGLFKVPETVAA